MAEQSPPPYRSQPREGSFKRLVRGDVRIERMDHLVAFYDQAKARSLENQKAFKVLMENGCYGVAAGLLRQELDTLIRVAYLCYGNLASDEVHRLVRDSVEGKRWRKINTKGKVVPVTDREMVNLANQIGGWESHVYDFGCKFIHLSDAHNYKFSDPTSSISESDRASIISYLKEKHEYPHNALSFDLVKPYLIKVMKKITGNIESLSEILVSMYENEISHP